MKTVILAGGFGTRIREESIDKPKPMVEIGNIPILYHIMKIYRHWGHNDFVVCLGYKGQIIKEYFQDYYLNNTDVKVEIIPPIFSNVSFEAIDEEKFQVILSDTGESTQTAGRIKRIQKYLNNERFMMTYGDGLTDANINDIIKFHEKSGTLATILAVDAPSKFGAVEVDDNGIVTQFKEKLQDGRHINGGFFVLEPEVFKYIHDDNTSWETDCLPKLVEDKQLAAYKYDGFWKCMDSIKDKEELNKMWNENRAPWKVWRD